LRRRYGSQLRREHLDRDDSLQHLIERPKNDAEATAAQDFEHLVMPQNGKNLIGCCFFARIGSDTLPNHLCGEAGGMGGSPAAGGAALSRISMETHDVEQHVRTTMGPEWRRYAVSGSTLTFSN
jgi:hypothetical protein